MDWEPCLKMARGEAVNNVVCSRRCYAYQRGADVDVFNSGLKRVLKRREGWIAFKRV